jgi:hypothetical protein
MSVELDINKLPDLIKEVLKDVQFTNEEYWVSVNDLKVDEESESYLPKLTDGEMNVLTASIETIKQPYPIVDMDGVIIGRAFRDPNDFVKIYLCDSRYKEYFSDLGLKEKEIKLFV